MRHATFVPVVGGVVLGVIVLALGPGVAVADRLALRDGTTMDGAVVVDPSAGTIVLTRTKGGMQFKEKVPFEKALAVEREDLGLSWLAAEDQLVDASRVLWQATERDRYMEWAGRAVKAGLGPLAAKFLDAAEKRGAVGYAVKSLRGKAAHLAPGPDADAESKALVGLEAALPKERAALLWKRLEPGWSKYPEERRVAWGEAVLAIDPTVDPVKRWFASLVPPEFAARFGWKEWLQWKRLLVDGATLHFPPPQGTPSKDLQGIDRETARAAFLWNPEVRGIERRGMLAVTRPPLRPAFEKAVALAGAICAYLEPFFATDKPVRSDLEPVLVWVYADRDDFFNHVSSAERAWVPVSSHVMPSEQEHQRAAFFAPNVGIVKVLWPDVPNPQDPDDGELRQDFCEHVVWAWLQARCPRFRPSDMGTHPAAPACFIDLAFAEALASAKPGPNPGGWTLARPDPPTLDALRALRKAGPLADWRDVLDASLSQLESLLTNLANPEAAAQRLFSWVLLARVAAEYLLFAADPATRAAFANQVTSHMTGKKDGQSTKEVYGVDPQELGRRIAAWAFP